MQVFGVDSQFSFTLYEVMVTTSTDPETIAFCDAFNTGFSIATFFSLAAFYYGLFFLMMNRS